MKEVRVHAVKLISKLQMYIGRYERSKSALCEIISKLQI